MDALISTILAEYEKVKTLITDARQFKNERRKLLSKLSFYRQVKRLLESGATAEILTKQRDLLKKRVDLIDQMCDQAGPDRAKEIRAQQGRRRMMEQIENIDFILR